MNNKQKRIWKSVVGSYISGIGWREGEGVLDPKLHFSCIGSFLVTHCLLSIKSLSHSCNFSQHTRYNITAVYKNSKIISITDRRQLFSAHNMTIY